MKWINAEQQVTVTIYDEEHEEYLDRIMSVEEMLDTYTNEGCPTIYSNPEQTKWIPVSEKYEHHIDHTDCIWYGNDSGCPVTCSQYRDGWNDAMDYIFKNGDGYRPYRRNENG